jgi:D-aminopeptidase
MYKPYTEIVDGKELSFHAKACADALKSMKYPRCTFCGGVVAYEPYIETIKGKKLPFHARACADAYKTK